jgi:hypothetical protein
MKKIECPVCTYVAKSDVKGWKVAGGPCFRLAGTKYENDAPKWCPTMSDAMPTDAIWLPLGYRAEVEKEIERVNPKIETKE